VGMTEPVSAEFRRESSDLSWLLSFCANYSHTEQMQVGGERLSEWDGAIIMSHGKEKALLQVQRSTAVVYTTSSRVHWMFDTQCFT
jgi:hypothetical protein